MIEHPIKGSITCELERWKEGDGEARGRVCLRFREQLLAEVRRRRSPHLQGRIDSAMVVDAALDCFADGVEGRFSGVRNRDEARRLLLSIVRKTLWSAIKHATAEKRNIQREVPLICEVPDDALDPLQTAEQLEAIFERVRGVHPHSIDIVELSLRGFSNHEIADRLGLGKRQIQVIKQRMLSKILEDMEDDPNTAIRESSP